VVHRGVPRDPRARGEGACPGEDTFRGSPHTRVNQTRRNALRTSKHSNALWWSTAEPDLYKCITAPRKVRGPRRERRQRERERERERVETSAQVRPLVRDLSACLPSLGVRAAQELMRLRDSLIDGRNDPRGFVRFIIFYNKSSTSHAMRYQSNLRTRLRTIESENNSGTCFFLLTQSRSLLRASSFRMHISVYDRSTHMHRHNCG